ncbi:MAG: bifunctional alpha/beta hydrolase/OsmC family protein [Pseudomonadota bacterium]
MDASIIKAEFKGSKGANLAARLDLPAGDIRAFAIFAHCFTCSKDLNATRKISGELAKQGIAVLRFDFTGLGASDGEFASTNFSSNVDDLIQAADWLRSNYQAPSLLIGHSLGGAAVLAAAPQIDEVNAVVTIGAPADAAHVTHNFAANVDQINKEGEAEVILGGRKFTIRKQFLEDLDASSVTERIGNMKKALLVMHSPTDDTVGIENSSSIFAAAKHPKSFISLDGADHLLTSERDAVFAARVVSSWVSRYLPVEEAVDEEAASDVVVVSETRNGKFQNNVEVGRHRLIADEPASVGGLDSGPTPYDFLSIGLGACTSMTMRMYADRKGIDPGAISVEVEHGKIHASDCLECTDEERNSKSRIDRFERRIRLSGDLDDEQRDSLLRIADKCPVHKTLEASSKIATRLMQD